MSDLNATSRRTSTRPADEATCRSVRRTRAFARSSDPTAITAPTCASASTTGTSPIPSVSKKDLRVTIQALVWRSGDRYLPLRDDIASVAYWYQTQPHNPFPPLPDKDSLEVK